MKLFWNTVQKSHSRRNETRLPVDTCPAHSCGCSLAVEWWSCGGWKRPFIHPSTAQSIPKPRPPVPQQVWHVSKSLSHSFGQPAPVPGNMNALFLEWPKWKLQPRWAVRAGRAGVKVSGLMVGFSGSRKDLELCKARSAENGAVQADCQHVCDSDWMWWCWFEPVLDVEAGSQV